MKRIQSLAISVALLSALAACTPVVSTPTPSATPKPAVSAKPKPTPTPTPTPTPAGLVVPGCDALLTLDQAKADFNNDRVEFIGEFGVDDFDPASTAARAAQQAAAPVRFCVWGIPNSDGGFSVTVGALASVDRDALIASLSASGYSSVTQGTITAMEYTPVDESESGGTHLFTGDVWIFVPGFRTAFTGTVAGQVLDSMRTANPTLGL